MGIVVVDLTSIFSSKFEFLGAEIILLDILISIAIFAIGVILARVLRMTVLRYVGVHLPEETRRGVNRAVYWGIIILAGLAALSNQGVDFTGALLGAGIFGIIIGFATQSLVANLISGLFMQIDKPMKIGDPVEIVDSNVAGVVTEVTAFSTRLRMFDGTYARLPNEKIFTSQIRNFSKNIARRVEFQVSIGYREDVTQAIAVINKTLYDIPMVLNEPAPNVFVDTLAESGVNINVFAWVPWQHWFIMRQQLVEKVKKELDAVGVELPYPQRVVWFAETAKNPLKST
jgi:small-conductance mechanosensitive channel